MSICWNGYNRKAKLIGAAIIVQVGMTCDLVAQEVSGDDPAQGAAARPETIEEKVDRMIAGLRNPAPKEQRKSVKELEKMGEDALPGLIVAARNKDDEIMRRQALEMIGRLGTSADSALEVLTEALSDPVPPVRRNAAWALGRIGPAGEYALEELKTSAEDVEWDVRADAVWAIGKISMGNPDADTVDAVVGSLNDVSGNVRWSAIWSLSRFGGAAREALPDLLDLVDDPDYKLRASVAHALANVAGMADSDMVIPALEKLAKDEHALVRQQAETALKAFLEARDLTM